MMFVRDSQFAVPPLGGGRPPEGGTTNWSGTIFLLNSIVLLNFIVVSCKLKSPDSKRQATHSCRRFLQLARETIMIIDRFFIMQESGMFCRRMKDPSSFILHPSSFVSSFILHPSSFVSSFVLHLFLILFLMGSVAYAAPGDILWKYETNAAIHSSPVLGTDGTVYVGSDDGHLHAVNPDGTRRWAYPTGAAIFSSPAVAADGTIYVGSDDKALHAINPGGSQKWTYPTGGPIQSSPAIGPDGVIHVGSADDHLYAINPDGTLKRRYETNGDVNSSPAIGLDGTVCVGSTDNRLHIITPGDTTRWTSYETEAGITFSSPAIGPDGTIYVGSTDYHLYAITPAGMLKWRYLTGSGMESSPAIGADGTVYVGSWDNILHAVHPDDGTRKWIHPLNEGIFSSPAIGAGKTIYVGGTDKRLYAIKTDSNLKWISAPTGGGIISSPAVDADGDVYVGSEDGFLYAFQGDFPWKYAAYVSPTEGYADSHWPKFGQNNLHLGRRSAFELKFPDLPAQSHMGEAATVPLILMNLNAEPIRKMDAEITFDPEIIEMTDITLAGGLFESGYSLDLTMDKENGKFRIKITADADVHATGEGTIATIQHHGKVEGGTGDLTFTTATVNGLLMNAIDGHVEIVPTYDLTGNVSYFGDQGAVPDVTLTLRLKRKDEAGHPYYDILETTETDAEGNYLFSDIPEGDYTVTPSKTDDLEGLSSLDASRILQYALGKTPPDCHQALAADVDRDGLLSETSEEAAKVAECSAMRDLGIMCLMNQTDDTEETSWTFTTDPIESCEEGTLAPYVSVRTFSPLNSDQTDQNFVGIMLGDVTGNWSGAKGQGSGGRRNGHPISQRTISALPESALLLPLILDPGADSLKIEGIDVVIRFDEDALAIDEAKTTLAGGAVKDWQGNLKLVKKDGDGVAAIRIYGSDEVTLTAPQAVAWVAFNVTGEAGTTASVSLEKLAQDETEASGGFEGENAIIAQTEIRIGYETGDIDHSKTVDLRDALLALKILAGMHPDDAVHTDTDANGDERTGTEDVVYILQAVSSKL